MRSIYYEMKIVLLILNIFAGTRSTIFQFNRLHVAPNVYDINSVKRKIKWCAFILPIIFYACAFFTLYSFGLCKRAVASAAIFFGRCTSVCAREFVNDYKFPMEIEILLNAFCVRKFYRNDGTWLARREEARE